MTFLEILVRGLFGLVAAAFAYLAIFLIFLAGVLLQQGWALYPVVAICAAAGTWVAVKAEVNIR